MCKRKYYEIQTMLIFKRIATGIALLCFSTAVYATNDPLNPSYPEIPSAYEVLRPGKLVAQANANFPTYLVKQTTGYQVKAPNGTEFVVDNIVKPKCAFYGTYVSTSDDGFLAVSSPTPVISNVYIGEVNFDKCQ